MVRHLTTAIVALVCGFLGAWLFALSGIGGGATRAWLLENPEVLPQMAERLQARIRESPEIDVVQILLSRDDRSVADLVVVVGFFDFGAKTFRELLHHPLRHVAAP